MKQFSYPNAQFVNITGGASIGWTMHVYNTGTTDYASIYSDAGQTVETDNPITADADGFFASFYWTGAIDVVIKDADDNTIDSAEGIQDLVSTILATVSAGGSVPAGIATGDGDAIAVTLAAQTTDFDDLAVFVVRANAANSGTALTPNLTVNSFPSRRIKKIGGSALLEDDIVANQNLVLLYNEAQDCYYLINHEATFLRRDGNFMMLGILDMGGFKITGMGAAVDASDAVRFDQCRTHYGNAAGSANAMGVSIPSVFSYVDGMRVLVNPPSSGWSTIGNPTININSLGVKTICDSIGATIGYGDIYGMVELVYNGILGKFVLMNPRFGSDFIGKVYYGYSTAAMYGTAELDGTIKSRATYPVLWSFIEANSDLFVAEGSWSGANVSKFSSGDGSTTFRMPMVLAESIRAWDHGRGVDAGRGIATFQEDALQNITGAFSMIGGNAGTTASGAIDNDGAPVDYAGAAGVSTQNSFTFDASRVARTSTETRSRNVALFVSIRAY